MTIKAWAPGHTTLFFAVPQKFTDPLAMGSIGVGLNFDAGVTTSVEAADSDQVYWNNHPIDGRVSLSVLELYRAKTGYNSSLNIHHESELQIGYGLSTSGAGAIGTALASDTFFSSDLSRTELFEIAHIAEIQNHTGLGSVMGQMVSGIEIRNSQGGPTKGHVRSIQANDEIFLVFFGPLSTADVLTSDIQMQQITKSGIDALNSIKNQSSPTLTTLIEISQQFMDTCGITTPKIKEAREELFELGETLVTMAMIGETLVILPKNTNIIARWIKRRKLNSCLTRITNKKPTILS
jgi:pantoate kinase